MTNNVHFNYGQIVRAKIRKICFGELVVGLPGGDSAIMSTKDFGDGEERCGALQRMRSGDCIYGRIIDYHSATKQFVLEYCRPRLGRCQRHKAVHKALDCGSVCIIDSANLLGYTGPEHAALVLSTLARELSSQGYRPVFYLEHRTYRWARGKMSDAEAAALDAFIRREDVGLVGDSGTQVKSEADASILQVAEAIEGSVCVTNDRYVDYGDMHPDIVGNPNRICGFAVTKLGPRTIIAVERIARAVVVDCRESVTDASVIKTKVNEDEDLCNITQGKCVAEPRESEFDFDNGEQPRFAPSFRRVLDEVSGDDCLDQDKIDIIWRREKRRIECERRYRRLHARAGREGCSRSSVSHFSAKRRAVLNAVAFKDGFEMIRAYYDFEPKFGGKCAA